MEQDTRPPRSRRTKAEMAADKEQDRRSRCIQCHKMLLIGDDVVLVQCASLLSGMDLWYPVHTACLPEGATTIPFQRELAGTPVLELEA